MREVTKADFFAWVYSLTFDIHPHIRRGPWPYTSDWKDRAGRTLAISADVQVVPGTIETTYWIKEPQS